MMVSHLVGYGFAASREAFRSLDKRISACSVQLEQQVRHTPVCSTFSLGLTTSGGADDGDFTFRQARSGLLSISPSTQSQKASKHYVQANVCYFWCEFAN